MSSGVAAMRIGELGQRVGVSTHVLRAWETRYGLMQPMRSTSGYRLYDAADERRVRAVVALREKGVPAAAACQRVLEDERAGLLGDGTGPGTMESILEELYAAVSRFDEAAAQAIVDRLLETQTLEIVIRHGLMPFLQGIGDRWARGDLSVAHEHFASHLVRRRFSALSLTWATGAGPIAVLACPPREQHDIPLLLLGLLLGRAGWQVRYLGQDTPLASLASACRTVQPDLVVLSATRTTRFEAVGGALRHLAKAYPLALGGRGASQAVSVSIGATRLPTDIIDAAIAASQLAKSRVS